MKTKRFHAATCKYIPMMAVCTVLLATVLASAQQDHLAVENPSFEQAGDDALPADWRYWQDRFTENEFSRSEEVARTGKASARLTATGKSCWLPEKWKLLADTGKPGPLGEKRQEGQKPNREYVVSAWVKRRGGTGSCCATLTLHQTGKDGWLDGVMLREGWFEPPSEDRWYLVTASTVPLNDVKHLVPLLGCRGFAPRPYLAKPGLFPNLAKEHAGAELFYDDVAIVDRTGLDCRHTEPTMTAPDGTYRLDFTVANRREKPMALTLTVDAFREGSEPSRQTVTIPAGGEHVFEAEFAGRGGTYANWTLTAADQPRTIYYGGEIKLPALPGDAWIASPLYRSTLFGGMDLATMRVACDLPLTADACRGMSFRVTLRGLEGQALAKGDAPARPGRNEFALDLPDLDKGEYPVEVVLRRDGTEQARTTLHLHVRPDITPIARFGDNGELIVQGKPRFPIGFYTKDQYDPSVKELKDYRKDGFDIVRGQGGLGQLLRLLPRMEQAGVMMMHSYVHPQRTVPELRKALAKLKSPALIGHYLWDEPDLNGLSPATLLATYDRAVELDPGRVNATVLVKEGAFPIYAPACDVLLVDPYPFRGRFGEHPPVEMIADHVRSARRAVRDRKPVWLVPQFYVNLRYGTGAKAHKPYMPTAQQQRCSVFLGLVHGAKGVVAYSYYGFSVARPEQRPGKRKRGFRHEIPEAFPLRYDAFAELARQVRGLKEVLYAPDPEQTQKVTEGGEVVHTLLKEHDGAWYLFVVNPKNRPVTFACSLPGLSGKAEVLWEDRTVEATDGTLKDTFEPYGVHVYRWAK
jgi:hypothetical protein